MRRKLFVSLVAGGLAMFAHKAGAQSAPAASVDGRFTAENNVWFNSPPLSAAALSGKVVLVNFWTYSCINSLRALPYVEAWAEKYKADGLVVIGAHTPEFTFEKDRTNVGHAVAELKLSYPIVMDSDYGIWNAFSNEYWPAFYLIDGTGRVRYSVFGEGQYAAIEHDMQKLLAENGAAAGGGTVHDAATGIEAPPSGDEQSPETYVGYNRAERFASPGGFVRNVQTNYSAPARLALNHWALDGSWNAGAERAILQTAPGRVRYRFHSRDLHFILGPARAGTPVRFRVTLDGHAPGADHGVDSAPDGSGVVREPRLYQLIRQKGSVVDRTFEIEFLDPGVQAYDFTFG